MKEESISFKYNVNAYKNGVIQQGDFVCGCCQQKVEYGYKHMYAENRPSVICVECLASGEAARKFDGSFVQSANTRAVSDPAKIDELFHRSPGYPSWQGEYFPACCNDFCSFIDDVGTEELEQMGIADELFADYKKRGGDPSVREELIAVGPVAGYLFQCLHCKQYHLHIDRE